MAMKAAGEQNWKPGEPNQTAVEERALAVRSDLWSVQEKSGAVF
jgi:hypothetical protein